MLRSKNFRIGAGYAFNLVIPGNLFFFVAALPAIGLNNGDVRVEQWYRPPNGPLVKTHFRVSLGRTTHKGYQILSYTGDFFISDLGNENVLHYNIGNSNLYTVSVWRTKRARLRKCSEYVGPYPTFQGGFSRFSPA